MTTHPFQQFMDNSYDNNKFLTCSPQKLLEDPTNIAPAVDYNLQASTSFKVQFKVPVYAENEWFRQELREIPNMTPWTDSKKDSYNAIYEKVVNDIIGVSANYINGRKFNVGSKIKKSSENKMLNNEPVFATKSVSTDKEHEPEILGHSASFIANQIFKGNMPYVSISASGTPTLRFTQEPRVARPLINIVFHARISSYYGNYGAGKTVKTFSLLPGEKTTISVRSFRSSEEKKKETNNVLNSTSKDVLDELEIIQQAEAQHNTGSSYGQMESTQFGIGGVISGGISSGLNIGIGSASSAMQWSINTDFQNDLTTTSNSYLDLSRPEIG